MRVKVEDTGQLTSCFNESEGTGQTSCYRSTYFVKVKCFSNKRE